MSKKATDFLFNNILGEGSFATVYAGVEIANRREVAIKVCEKRLIQSERKAVYIMNEKNIMALLNDHPHPFLVRLYCTFQDNTRLLIRFCFLIDKMRFYLDFVMSLAKNGDLLSYLKKLGSFSEPVCQFYSAELILALEHLHSLGIVHRLVATNLSFHSRLIIWDKNN
ncbi:unnamed protein product [Soboliphyme baturini]|uniref:non-specific serine/threonine protein kinase n=1 Tax=Soboliphyme baturini TaxID=241478 RepID=A0A183IL02_9BILA|nr:unnamed protein product [Soboliphyme baturini]